MFPRSKMNFVWLLLTGIWLFIGYSDEQIVPPMLSHQQAQVRKLFKNMKPFELRWISRDPENMADGVKAKTTTPASIGNIASELLLVDQSSKFPTAFTPANISQKCRDDSFVYYVNHILQQGWAQAMYGATGNFPDGSSILGGSNIHATGLFEQCINSGYSGNDTAFEGQYCTSFYSVEDETIQLPQDLDGIQERDYFLSISQILESVYSWKTRKEGPIVADPDLFYWYLPSTDFCIPSSCSAQDFRSAVAGLVGRHPISMGWSADNSLGIPLPFFTYVATIAGDDYCFTREKINRAPELDGPDIAVIVTLSLIAILVVLSTAHEIARKYMKKPIDGSKDSVFVRVLHCFSALNNSKKLLSTNASSENLSCLNGIRVLSTTWVVMAHTYFILILNPVSNFGMVYEDAQEWQYQGLLNATVAVDTFFLMSGLLVSYLLLKELDRNKGRFNPLMFYVHRFLRLTPVYAIILGFIATLYVDIGNGPRWPNLQYNSLACRWNWWNNLLYVNNYVKTYPYDCMGETWYLACDMQMFLLSPLFIYPLWRWWKAGLVWTVTAIVALLSGTLAIFIIWKLPMTNFNTRPTETSNPHYMPDYYVQMWTRFAPYLLGIILGWILFRTKNTTVKINKLVVITCWACAVATGLAVVYGVAPYTDETAVPEINNVVRVSYGTFNRFAWSASVGWVIFACIKGYGGFVNTLLSWKVFMPLGRLTYVVYLVHLNFLYLYFSHERRPYYYTELSMVLLVLGVTMFVFLLSFVVSVTVEASFLNLEKLLFGFALPTRKAQENGEKTGESTKSSAREEAMLNARIKTEIKTESGKSANSDIPTTSL